MENFKTDFEKILKESNLSEKEIAFKNLNAKEFSSHGFPNRKHEDWKFSDINQIIKKEIGELNFYNEELKKKEIDESILQNEIEHNKLIFINGQLAQIDFNSEDKGANTGILLVRKLSIRDLPIKPEAPKTTLAQQTLFEHRKRPRPLADHRPSRRDNAQPQLTL